MGTLKRYFRVGGWLITIAAVLVVVGVVLGALKPALGGAAIGVGVLASLAPQAAKGIKWLNDRRKEEKSLLRINRPISQVDPFGERLVFSSALAEQDYLGGEPAYIPRDTDDALRGALGTKRFVLLTGASKSGKSRTAFEAARSIDPEPILLVPASPDKLPKLLELGLPVGQTKPAVLWLDDLDRYLRDPAIRLTLFEGLEKQDTRVVVLATITSTARDQLYGTEGEIGRSAREILDLFEEVYLHSKSSSQELKEAERLYPSQSFEAGIGEHFAAARELIRKFVDGLEAKPHGFAVVVAALDWRRTGMPRPMKEEELRELYPSCLEHFYPQGETDGEGYKDGLAWACSPLQSRAALLMRVLASDGGEGGFRIFDYVRDWVDSGGSQVDPGLRGVLDSTWPFVIGRATPEESYAVGIAAYYRGVFHPAEDALRKAADAEDVDVAPKAAYNLGVLLEEQGRLEEAEEPYRKAMASGDPSAGSNLGILLYKQGRPGEAEEAFRQGMASADPEVAPKAAYNLGKLLEEQGRLEEAEEAYRQAMASADPEVAPSAASNLGILLYEQGRLEEAEEPYRKAMASGDPSAGSNLGILLEEQGRLEEAEEAYRQAMASADPEVAPKAGNNLGILLEEQGRLEEAEEAYRQAMASGSPDVAPSAAYNLGILLEEQGRLEEAEEAFRKAMASGDPSAGSNLGILLEEQGRLEEVEEAYRQAMASGSPDVAPSAAYNLGVLLQRQGRPEAAEKAYELAISFGSEGSVMQDAEQALRQLRGREPT